MTDDLAVVQGVTDYPAEVRRYSNLWLIRFDSRGQCTEFTEWFMAQPHPK